MNIIGNKMFAYIDNHGELTQSMVNQYNDSMIFLGDEKQIFVPLINAYVGIGTTAYNNLLSQIGQSNDNLNEYNKYIHNDTVTSIYTQFSPNEIKDALRIAGTNSINIRDIYVDEDTAYTAFKANKNIVFKGLNDYNLPDRKDELGNIISTYNTSGITLNIEHNGTIQVGRYEFNGVQYSYTYFEPYDTITIDDTKTWSYITASNSYMTNFVTKFATEQANRVYKNLLGETDVYIQKEFDEAFNYDNNTDYNTNWLYDFKDVYVKLSSGAYQKVTVENDTNGGGFAILLNGQVIYTNMPISNGQITINGTNKTVLDNNSLKGILAGENNNGLWGGYIELVNHDIVPIWYHRDDSASTNTYNMNIVDGIQTIKEVAYILDVLTDGSQDGAINLAYNISHNYVEIEKLKAWQERIGTETVSSFKSESSNELLTVNYYSTNLWDKDRDADGASIGKVKLDLDLKLAQTYILDGVTYAAYLPNHPGANVTYFAYTGDPSDPRNYLMLDNNPNTGTGGIGTKTDEVVWLLQNQDPKYLNSSTVIPIYTLERNDPNDGSKITGAHYEYSVDMGSINNNTLTGKYIYFPYKLSQYQLNKGLTDVKWVTTYVGWACEDLANRLSGVNDAVMTYITDKIEALDYDDYDNTYLGMFVSQVSEEDGIIRVTKEKLPLDTILKHDIFYTNDIYLHITTHEAKQGTNIDHIYRYAQDNITNTYQFMKLTSTQVNDLSGDVDMYPDIYYKTNLASMQSVPGGVNGATVGDMVLNAGNVTYFYKKETNGYTEYLPLDIHTAYTEGTLFTDDVVANDNTIYYWGGTATQVKYFDINTIHRTDGSTTTLFTSYITYLSTASAQNSGLADAWDVRRTIESMFQWVNIKTNKIIS